MPDGVKETIVSLTPSRTQWPIHHPGVLPEGRRSAGWRGAIDLGFTAPEMKGHPPICELVTADRIWHP